MRASDASLCLQLHGVSCTHLLSSCPIPELQVWLNLTPSTPLLWPPSFSTRLERVRVFMGVEVGGKRSYTYIKLGASIQRTMD